MNNSFAAARACFVQAFCVIVIMNGVGLANPAQAERLSLSGLKNQVDALEQRLSDCEQGVDGIIAVCSGAGGHAGPLNPFALIKEIREEFDGTLILSGCITSGSDVVAARALGADLAYSGTRFIATEEANARSGYKQMIVDSAAADIVNSSLFTGIHGNYLKGSIRNVGMDPEALPEGRKEDMDFSKGSDIEAKVWKDIWGAGQGVGNIDDILPARDVVLRMEKEYRAALARVNAA